MSKILGKDQKDGHNYKNLSPPPFKCWQFSLFNTPIYQMGKAKNRQEPQPSPKVFL